MDKQRFQGVCNDIVAKQREKNGIGTLGEKTLHAILKSYYEPDTTNQEIRTCGFVADIRNESGIIEIQTRSFDKLRKKLEAFLQVEKVTIVYPIPYIKWLRWINEETGEVLEPRKSPKKGTPYMIFPELYKIKNYLTHPNLNVLITMINLEEFKKLNGWSKDKKRGSERFDRIPIELVEEIPINPKQYYKLIPDNLPKRFTSRDYQKGTKLSLSNAQTALNVLTYVEAVERVGKQGNSILYEINEKLRSEN